MQRLGAAVCAAVSAGDYGKLAETLREAASALGREGHSAAAQECLRTVAPHLGRAATQNMEGLVKALDAGPSAASADRAAAWVARLAPVYELLHAAASRGKAFHTNFLTRALFDSMKPLFERIRDVTDRLAAHDAGKMTTAPSRKAIMRMRKLCIEAVQSFAAGVGNDEKAPAAPSAPTALDRVLLGGLVSTCGVAFRANDFLLTSCAWKALKRVILRAAFAPKDVLPVATTLFDKLDLVLKALGGLVVPHTKPGAVPPPQPKQPEPEIPKQKLLVQFKLARFCLGQCLALLRLPVGRSLVSKVAAPLASCTTRFYALALRARGSAPLHGAVCGYLGEMVHQYVETIINEVLCASDVETSHQMELIRRLCGRVEPGPRAKLRLTGGDECTVIRFYVLLCVVRRASGYPAPLRKAVAAECLDWVFEWLSQDRMALCALLHARGSGPDLATLLGLGFPGGAAANSGPGCRPQSALGAVLRALCTFSTRALHDASEFAAVQRAMWKAALRPGPWAAHAAHEWWSFVCVSVSDQAQRALTNALVDAVLRRGGTIKGRVDKRQARLISLLATLAPRLGPTSRRLVVERALRPFVSPPSTGRPVRAVESAFLGALGRHSAGKVLAPDLRGQAASVVATCVHSASKALAAGRDSLTTAAYLLTALDGAAGLWTKRLPQADAAEILRTATAALRASQAAPPGDPGACLAVRASLRLCARAMGAGGPLIRVKAMSNVLASLTPLLQMHPAARSPIAAFLAECGRILPAPFDARAFAALRGAFRAALTTGPVGPARMFARDAFARFAARTGFKDRMTTFLTQDATAGIARYLQAAARGTQREPMAQEWDELSQAGQICAALTAQDEPSGSTMDIDPGTDPVMRPYSAEPELESVVQSVGALHHACSKTANRLSPDAAAKVCARLREVQSKVTEMLAALETQQVS